MAKKAIPRFLIPALGALALTAAYLVHSNRNGGSFLTSPNAKGEAETAEAPLPPVVEPTGPPPRPDAELLKKWAGTSVPEILTALRQDPPDAYPPPPPPLTFPKIEGIDPYLPRFEANSSGDSSTLPAFDDAVMLDGSLILSTDGAPLIDSAITGIGGRRLLPADFDHDGDTDLFIGRGKELPSSLLRRGKDGGFEDVTTAAGLLEFLDLIDAAWVDFDRDGRLDLFTVSHAPKAGDPSVLQLFHNLDNNRFEEISGELALTVDGPVGDFLWHDVDDDAYPDLFLSLAGDPGTLRLLASVPAQNATRWSFTDATATYGLVDAIGGGPLAIGDFNQDGQDDLVTTANGKLTLLARTPADSGFAPFADVTEALELGGVPLPGDLLFEDFDGDGFLDLALIGGTNEAPASRAWWNVGGLRFREIPGAAGLATSSPLQRLIRLDSDGDGIAEILTAAGSGFHGQLLTATTETIADNARLVLTLNGDEASNRNGFGAVATVVVRDENWTLSTIERQVNEVSEVIGLGAAKQIQSIKITWPDLTKTTTELGEFPINQQLEIGPDPENAKVTPLATPEISTGTASPETGS